MTNWYLYYDVINSCFFATTQVTGSVKIIVDPGTFWSSSRQSFGRDHQKIPLVVSRDPGQKACRDDGHHRDLSSYVFLQRKPKVVIPAKAGIQVVNLIQGKVENLDPRFRGDDDSFGCGGAAL